MENEEDPLLEHEEKDGDDDDDDTTNPFHSTPGPSGEEIPMTIMNREKEKGPGIAETSFIEGSPLSRVLTSNEKAWETLKREFPDAKATELEAFYSKTGKLQVREVWFWQEGLSFVHRWKRRRRTKVESNSPEKKNLHLDQSVKF